MEHHDRRAGALVDVGEADPLPLAEVRLPGEAGQALEEHVGRPDGVGHLFPPRRSSRGSSTFASRAAVTWMARAERDQAITLSTCRRSRTYWKASAWRFEAYVRETSNVQPPSSDPVTVNDGAAEIVRTCAAM